MGNFFRLVSLTSFSLLFISCTTNKSKEGSFIDQALEAKTTGSGPLAGLSSLWGCECDFLQNVSTEYESLVLGNEHSIHINQSTPSVVHAYVKEVPKIQGLNEGVTLPTDLTFQEAISFSHTSNAFVGPGGNVTFSDLNVPINVELAIFFVWEQSGIYHISDLVFLRFFSNNPSYGFDEDGWSLLTPTKGYPLNQDASRIIYVSNSECPDTTCNGNSGLSEEEPLSNISDGIELLRPGKPDWLLLKRGDTFSENSTAFSFQELSGRSIDEPVVIGNYGKPTLARPLIRTNGHTGMRLEGINGGSAGSARSDHVRIVGLHFDALPRGGSSPTGIRFMRNAEDLTIEDVFIEHFDSNIILRGYEGATLNDVRVLRSTFSDAFSTGSSNAKNMYIDNVTNLLRKESTFHRGGWSEQPGSTPPTTHRHNIYDWHDEHDDVLDTMFINNIVSDGSSHGLQARGGGWIENNLFARNAIQLMIGGGSEPENNPGGVEAEVFDNVFIDAKDIDSGLPRRWGVEASNIKRLQFDRNVFAETDDGNCDIRLDKAKNDFGIEEATFSENIFTSTGRMVHVLDFDSSFIENILFRNNDFQDVFGSQQDDNSVLVRHEDSSSLDEFTFEDNRFYSTHSSGQWFEISGVGAMSIDEYLQLVFNTGSQETEVSYPDPNRNISTYMDMLGHPNSDHGDYIAEVKKQRKYYWRPEFTAPAFNDYIRQGFGK